MAKVLVTGASGFVGSHIVEECLRRGLKTYAGIRSTSSKKYLTDSSIHFCEINFSDPLALAELLRSEQFDYIIHNAGLTSALNKDEFFEVNFGYTKLLVDLARKEIVDLKKFVFMSSLAAIGPADHAAEGILTSDSFAHPVTYYGESKLAAEHYIESLEDLPYTIIRPTAVFGPRDTDMFLLFKSIKRKFAPSIGFETQQLTFIYVKDLARVTLDVALSQRQQQAYFVTSGETFSAKEFNTLISKKLDVRPIHTKIPIPLFKVIARLSDLQSKIKKEASILNPNKVNELKAKNFNCDISPLIKDFNFAPQYSIEEAISETADWYLEQKWL